MGDMEKTRTKKEAMEAASKATASADRARLWAGLNQLAFQAAHSRGRVPEQRDSGERSEKHGQDKS